MGGPGAEDDGVEAVLGAVGHRAQEVGGLGGRDEFEVAAAGKEVLDPVDDHDIEAGDLEAASQCEAAAGTRMVQRDAHQRIHCVERGGNPSVSGCVLLFTPRIAPIPVGGRPFMFDLFAVLFAFGILAVVFTVIGLVLKLVLGILLIPFHIAFWLLKGTLLLVLGIVVLTVLLPALPVILVLGLLALPLLFVGWLASSCAL